MSFLAAERAQYEREGATLVKQVLPPQWIADLRDYVRELLRSATQRLELHAKCQCAGPIGESTVFISDNGTFYWQYLARDDAKYFAKLQEPPLCEAVKAITGIRELRFWYEEIYIKETKAVGTGWHQDVASLHFKGEHVPIGWIPLTDVDRRSSPMCTIVGSNLEKSYLMQPTHNRDRALRLPGYRPAPDYSAMVGQDYKGCRIWTMKAGDLLLMNPYTVHCSLDNVSLQLRASISMRWLGEDIHFTPDAFTFVDPWLKDFPAGVASPPQEVFPIVSSSKEAGNGEQS